MALAALSPALGIMAATAICSVVQGILSRLLSYHIGRSQQGE
jgi:hypothetical protein